MPVLTASGHRNFKLIRAHGFRLGHSPISLLLSPRKPCILATWFLGFFIETTLLLGDRSPFLETIDVGG